MDTSNRETVPCWRCGQDTPVEDAYPYWLRVSGGPCEWERREYCPKCIRQGVPANAQPELAF